MVSNVHNLTSLLRWSKIIGHSDSIALDADLCMDINEYQSILSVMLYTKHTAPWDACDCMYMHRYTCN